MTKNEFIEQLDQLLHDLPQEEKEAALTYYSDYFEDAGEENTDKVIAELVSPERVAATIKSNLSDNGWKDSDQFIYTENGYKDTTIDVEQFEVLHRAESGQQKTQGDTQSQAKYTAPGQGQNEGKAPVKENKTAIIILVCIIAVISFPVWFPLAAGVIGILIGLVAACFGLYVALLAVSAALLVAGIALVIAGVVNLFLVPLTGILICGAGLIVFGIGTLFSMLSFFVTTKVIPVLFNGFIQICRLPFRKRGMA